MMTHPRSPFPRIVAAVALALASMALAGAVLAHAEANASAKAITEEGAMRKGIRAVAKLEKATASRISVVCQDAPKVGDRGGCTGSFFISKRGQQATYRLGNKARTLRISPGAFMYRVHARRTAGRVAGVPSRLHLAGFLQGRVGNGK